MKGQPFNWKTLKLLVADSDDQFRFWARGLFKQLGTETLVSIADLGLARGHLQGGDFSMLILAAGDDGKASLSLLEWLRDPSKSPNPHLPVVLIGKPAADIAVVRALGVQGYLDKPVSGQALTSAVIAARSARPQLQLWEPVRSIRSSLTRTVPPVKPTPTQAPKPAGTARVEAAPHPVGGAFPADNAGRAAGGGTMPWPEDRGQGRPKTASFLEPAGLAADSRAGRTEWEIDTAPVEGRSSPLSLDGVDKPAAKRAAGGETFDLDAVLAGHAAWVESRGREGIRANLDKRDLSGRDLTGVILISATLRRVDLSGANLTEAQLQGADLRDSEILGAVLDGANLAVSKLRHARLRGSRMDGANLKGADLAGADLAGVLFGQSDLAGANLLGADLAGADLSSVKGLVQAQLDDVRGDDQTRLPLGLRLAQD